MSTSLQKFLNLNLSCRQCQERVVNFSKLQFVISFHLQSRLNIRGLFLNTDFFYIIDKNKFIVTSLEETKKTTWVSEDIQTHQPFLLRLEGGLCHSTQGKIEYDTVLIDFSVALSSDRWLWWVAATHTEYLRSKGRPSSFHVRSYHVSVKESPCEALKSDLNLRSSVGRGLRTNSWQVSFIWIVSIDA